MAKKKVLLTIAAAAALMMTSPAVNKAEAATTSNKVNVYQYSNMGEFNSFLEQLYSRYGLTVPKLTTAEQGTSQTKQPVKKETAEPSQQPQNTASPQEPVKTQTTNGISAYEQKVVDLTNQERAKNGLRDLKVDVELSKMAHEKSRDMSANGYFDHTSPTYGSPFDMMKQYGISYRYAGENIAMGQKTPEEVVKAWMNSEGHRKNILSPNFTHIGVGYVSQGNYWTQEFIGR
ncbi:CAP domain-containing protein [Neobacillus mesonae]|uniref:CAP domain-containing protein n=1 Tax=Neobacillus mesonae TaxID=1193713 RepID=UPI00203AA9D0|nr:CAP domain-containing protein [Neobacillus mesonae]MCM3569831.1 CAP domain-containing protein [Neobacillus mesonae]